MTPDEKWLLDEKYNRVETSEYEEDKKRGACGEPLGYVIGWQPFLGLKIYLDSKPLIPRPETEWWTEQLLNTIVQDEPASQGAVVRLGLAARSATATGLAGETQFRFLDLCAGSGAIGCAALKTLPYMKVFLGEIDPVHETTIQKNIRENHLDETRADVRIGDLFEPFGDMVFDVIAVNPPYVPSGRVLPASVANYEPSLALLSGEDGLDLIRRIALELPKHLAKDGIAWVECDRGHAEASRTLFVDQGFQAEIRTDQYGKPRILVVSFP